MASSPRSCWWRARPKPECHRLARLAALGSGLAIATFGCTHATAPPAATATDKPACLASGNGYLRARLNGEINTEIDWANAGTQCEGMPRPTGRGLRLSFARAVRPDGGRLVIVFGVAGVGENESGRELPVNVTVIVEKASLIFGTRGDDKCLIDRLNSQPVPHAGGARLYRIEARGFCTEPARAVLGSGSVLVSTFDFAGQVRFDDDPETPGPRPEGSI
jgi:hypothetical protein